LSDVHKLTIQIRPPRGTDGGKVQIGYYVVVDGYVVLTDENGQPNGNGKRLLNEGGNAKVIACAMLRSSRRYGNSRSSGFNDRLVYQKIRY
jgi:hypothetical protein